MDTTLEPTPEGWQQLLAVVAHPDDLEDGAASAVARWTDAGRDVAYVIVTDGEAGIDAAAPEEAAADVSSTLDVGVESLETHRASLDGLGRDFDPAEVLRAMTLGPGRALGVEHAVTLGRIQLAGV